MEFCVYTSMKEADSKLRQSRSEIADAEQVATNTLTRLREQREILEKSKRKIEDVGKDLSDSNKTVDSLSTCTIL